MSVAHCGLLFAPPSSLGLVAAVVLVSVVILFGFFLTLRRHPDGLKSKKEEFKCRLKSRCKFVFFIWTIEYIGYTRWSISAALSYSDANLTKSDPWPKPSIRRPNFRRRRRIHRNRQRPIPSSPVQDYTTQRSLSCHTTDTRLPRKGSSWGVSNCLWFFRLRGVETKREAKCKRKTKKEDEKKKNKSTPTQPTQPPRHGAQTLTIATPTSVT